MNQNQRVKKPGARKPVMIGGSTLAELSTLVPWRATVGWICAIAVADLHIEAAMYLKNSPEAGGWLYPLILGAPAVLSMIVLPGGLRRWYRWAAIGALSLTTYADWVTVVLVVAETWALHRQWVTELDGGIIRHFRRTRDFFKAVNAGRAVKKSQSAKSL